VPSSHRPATLSVGAELCAQITSIQISLYLAELQREDLGNPMTLAYDNIERQRLGNTEALPALSTIYVKGTELQLSSRGRWAKTSIAHALRFSFEKSVLEVRFVVELDRILRAAPDSQA